MKKNNIKIMVLFMVIYTGWINWQVPVNLLKPCKKFICPDPNPSPTPTPRPETKSNK